MQRMNGGVPMDIITRRMSVARAGSRIVSHDPYRQGLLVASYNAHKCVGTDGRFDPQRTAQVIREINADVIATGGRSAFRRS